MNDSPPLPSGLLKVYAACAKWSLVLLAAAWLVLALAWGALHWWIVPRVGELRPVLETRASQALGVPVRIGAITARSTGLIPEVELHSVVLLDAQGREALRLPRVVAAPSPRSLWNLGFEQLYIERPELDVRRLADGRVLVAGLDLSRGDAGDDSSAADWLFSQREFVLRGGTVRWTDEKAGAAPLVLADVDLLLRNGARRHAIRLEATPPSEWGDRFTVAGLFRQPILSTDAGRWQQWDGELHADFRRVDLRELRRYAQPGWQVDGGHGAVRAWVDIEAGRPVGAVADLSVAQVSTRLGAGLPPLELATLGGRLSGQWGDEGFELQARQLHFVTREGQHWPAADLFVAWSPAEGRRPESGELRADRIELGALGQLAGRLPLGESTHAALARFAPQGRVENLQARWQGAPQAPQKYQARGRVAGLQIAGAKASDAAGQAVAGRPGVRNAAADFEFNEAGGKARLALDGGALELPGVFEDPVLAFDRLSGDVQWQVAGERITVSATQVRFSNADAQGEAQATWRTGDAATNRFPGVLDLQGSLARANGARVWRYLPVGVPKSARDYVREAVPQAEVADARFRVKGALDDFPFDRQPGEFRVTGQVRNATYAFVPRSLAQAGEPPWPALAQVSARLVFDRAGMRVEDASGRFNTVPGLRWRAEAAIPDLAQPTVGVEADVRGPLGEALAVVQRSPVSALIQDALARAVGSGPADVRLKLALPVDHLERSTVQGSVTLAGNDVQITPDSPAFSRARGKITFSDRGFSLAGVQARALGGDVRVEGGTRAAGNDTIVVVRAQGMASAEGLRQARELGFVSGLARQATGSAAYVANVTFRQGTPEVQVSSNLLGLALDLPAPLAKAANVAMPLRYENTLVRDGGAAPASMDQLSFELGQAAQVQFVRDIRGAEPRVVRGAIAVGLAPGEASALPATGVSANIRLGAANLDAWQQVFDGMAAPSTPAAARAPAASGADTTSSYLPTTFALRARELTVEGRTLHDVVVGGSRDGLVWRGNVDAQELSGHVEYRQSRGAGAGRVHARLARLSIGGATANAVETLLDEQPGSIPALDVVVDDFELRGRKLGRLEIDAINRGGGAVAREGGIREWRLNKLQLTLPEATFSATGNWAAVDAQPVPAGGPRPPRVPPERRRTLMNFRLDLHDAGQLLTRFGTKDVVRRGQGHMEGQVAWMGSPLGFDYPSMQGFFHIDVERGQFLKADPGLAKLLGVLSLQSLPRRLALDFRDVFSQGFAFDFVRGDITIQSGVAATNNLQMKGVNAAVLMEGKADLARETQDIRVVVVPEINAGTASLVAAAINPAVGLGTFLAQIFLREPLARAATQQFHIDGTWADPRVTKLARPAASEPSRSADAHAAGTN